MLNAPSVPCIIVSASGVATGGRVVNHLRSQLPDPRNTVVLVGYQAIGTRGRDLLDGARHLKMHGRYVPVHCDVVELSDYSVHADADELVAWFARAPKEPDTCFVVHGGARGILGARRTHRQRPRLERRGAPPRGEGATGLTAGSLRDQNSRLLVVHAWEDLRYGSAAWSVLAQRVRPATDQAARVADAIAPWRAQHPDVEVLVVLLSGDPAEVLRRHGGSADLLVIGGCQPVRGNKLLLGSTARAVIEGATCPVAVVHDAPLAVQRASTRLRVPPPARRCLTSRR